MSLRKKHEKPITKGLALILAREILGPSAHVLVKGPECVIVAPGCAIYTSNWDTALEEAHKHPNAEIWQAFKDDRKQAFYNAVDSLRTTIREILGSKDVKLFTRAEHKFVRGSLGRLA
jgi:hypothetical protein